MFTDFYFHGWQGYIRGEEFNLKKWIIPGLGYDICGNTKCLFLLTNNMYTLKEISIKRKRIADTVEALIGAISVLLVNRQHFIS